MFKIAFSFWWSRARSTLTVVECRKVKKTDRCVTWMVKNVKKAALNALSTAQSRSSYNIKGFLEKNYANLCPFNKTKGKKKKAMKTISCLFHGQTYKVHDGTCCKFVPMDRRQFGRIVGFGWYTTITSVLQQNMFLSPASTTPSLSFPPYLSPNKLRLTDECKWLHSLAPRN